MVAKKLALAFCAFSFLQTSFAGFERFWIFSKDANTQVSDTWDSLSDAEQLALIKRYQSLKEIPSEQSTNLQQRMDWFNQLPDADKQRMRETWQKMSTQERKDLAHRLQRAAPDDRASIREEYINKYLKVESLSH
jgi:DNA phosphorothioation-dependent restriction protein DptG